jgi:DNA-binding NtrC family response regulator
MARILIVEDEPNLSCLYLEELESEGHQVVAVRNRESVGLLEEMPMDLVVFDLTIPKGKGLDCIQKTLARHPNLKVIINVSYPTFKPDFYSWCAERFFTKTSGVSELKSAINELLAVPRAPMADLANSTKTTRWRATSA